ncbi:MAG: NAD-dependent epimerase/dehydratase family protein [Chloroflexi bacterium]|nr:NAD-dependent epimerase/dehydratase family protein [Chloroflexota bacterium]
MSPVARAVVTGSTGFVGSHIVDRLAADGCAVTGISNTPPRREPPEGVTEQLADIRDADAVEALVADARPDVVFHLAAQASVPVSMRNPVADILVNVIGSVNVAQAAAAAGARRLVFFSTGGALFGQPEELPAGEHTPVEPQSVYGASKIAAEHELGALCRHLGLELSVLRPGNIYGPGQDAAGESGVVAIFATRMLMGAPARIFGDGSQQRDYVYVDDVVDAALLAATGEPATCEVGSGVGTATLDIFRHLAALTGYTREPVFAPERPGDPHAVYLDPSRARERWGWEASTSLEEGLAATVEWFRADG